MRYSILISLLLFQLFILSSCLNEKSKKDNIYEQTNINSFDSTKLENAFQFTNEAVVLLSLIDRPLSKDDSADLLLAMNLLNKAIEEDSLYYSAYLNRAKAYSLLNQYDKSFRDYRVIERIKPDMAETYTLQGFLYEKLGKNDLANQKYYEAIRVYDKLINNADKIDDRINRAFILSLVNKEKGDSEIEKLIEEYPNDTNLLFWKEKLFEDFDREEYINSLFK
jgi:Tfp pilus assembly protein PilF